MRACGVELRPRFPPQVGCVTPDDQGAFFHYPPRRPISMPALKFIRVNPSAL